ncbi:hypothetical protein DVA86_23075 [Streptomyces armeniacus]|uniref:Uncharacterized protein n=1 Tax=Streptomyces armeniacus TaxID=83291 RepID=A0A345XTY2_9ACTN|nr:hypothetical protein [Streptomyces armeniacus]AXK35098.1 hypothetical protein DVA86_23075 [Streptomyces armeniacus]
MTEAADAWEFRARLALAERSVEKDLRDTVLAEVTAHCTESGETPEDAFGSPDDFAETVVSERLPAGALPVSDPDAWTGADYGAAVAAQLGVMAFVTGAYLTVADGFMTGVTAGALAGSAGTAAAVAAVHGVPLALRAGFRGRAVGCGLVALGALFGAAGAFTQLPGEALVRVPTPSVCVVGVLLLLWPLLHTPKSASSASSELSEPSVPSSGLPPEAWLRKLPQLLEARHAFARARALELTEEASRHAAEAGTAPEEEFGPVAAYARRLAETESDAARRRWWRVLRWCRRDDVRHAAALALFGTYLAHNVHSDGPLWLTAVAAVGTLTSGSLLAGHLRERGARGGAPA